MSLFALSYDYPIVRAPFLMNFKANELAKTTIDKTIAAIERRFVGSNQTIVAKAMQMFDVQTFGADYGKARSWTQYGRVELQSLTCIDGIALAHGLFINIEQAEEERVQFFKQMEKVTSQHKCALAKALASNSSNAIVAIQEAVDKDMCTWGRRQYIVMLCV